MKFTKKEIQDVLISRIMKMTMWELQDTYNSPLENGYDRIKREEKDGVFRPSTDAEAYTYNCYNDPKFNKGRKGFRKLQ